MKGEPIRYLGVGCAPVDGSCQSPRRAGIVVMRATVATEQRAIVTLVKSALAREGVITTAVWKAGMVLSHMRAIECIQRHQHINTHFARRADAIEAMAFAEESGWMPVIDEPIVPFERLPELAQRYESGVAGLFPVYSVNA
jgi:hypothetical protein